MTTKPWRIVFYWAFSLKKGLSWGHWGSLWLGGQAVEKRLMLSLEKSVWLLTPTPSSQSLAITALIKGEKLLLQSGISGHPACL